jgi:magnesium transporter
MLRKPHSRKAGLPPGSLVFLGEQRVEQATISVMDYDAVNVREATLTSADACREYLDRQTTTWINVTGLHDIALLESLGQVFDLHPLVMEDILNTGRRPTFEDLDRKLFLVVKMLYRRRNANEVVSEQVSLILGDGYLLTFQEIEGDVFDTIRERIRAGQGRIRRMGCDYLAYALLDAIVDNYFVVLEDVGEEIEALQERVLQRPDPITLQNTHRLKRDLIFMRKHLWPLREVVNALDKSENVLIKEDLTPFLRDVYEHTFQVIETLETLRDMLSSAIDTYMTVVSNRMNEIMKVLTVIATIFIPLTFIAGIYGMNFRTMPELQWPFGYPLVLSMMAALGVGMAVFFKRRRWW